MKKCTPPGAEGLPLFRQVYLRFRESIEQGRLKTGDRVPSIRALASELSLSRGTIEAAYQLLTGEGYLVTQGAAGTVVAPLRQGPAGKPFPASAEPAGYTPNHGGQSPRPFQLGLPALDAFPSGLWHRLANRTLRYAAADDLIYPDVRGYLPLREAVAGWLGVSRGVSCSPGQVFIVAGYRAALDLICRSLLSRGDACWMEDPGYFAARHVMREAGARLVPVPVDDRGLVVTEGLRLAPEARFAIVTPTHHSPLCLPMSLDRREALLAWAQQRQSWIIEDDYDSEFHYQGRPLLALKSQDRDQRVLYCGTFSKMLFPALRLGWLVVPQALVDRFTQTADLLHNHCPLHGQRLTASFIHEGHFARHLCKMRRLYAVRRRMLVEALTEAAGSRLLIDPQPGGIHLVARLAAGLDDVTIARRATSAGLSVMALSDWCLASPPQQGLLLSFTNLAHRAQANALSAQLTELLRP